MPYNTVSAETICFCRNTTLCQNNGFCRKEQFLPKLKYFFRNRGISAKINCFCRNAEMRSKKQKQFLPNNLPKQLAETFFGQTLSLPYMIHICCIYRALLLSGEHLLYLLQSVSKAPLNLRAGLVYISNRHPFCKA